MEKAVEWTASVRDHETEAEKKVQTDESVRKISSDLCCEILGLDDEGNTIELCKRKNTLKTAHSVEIPVINHVDTTEFMNAASRGKLDVVDKYLADGGNPNVHDELKRTALHRAALEGHTTVVQSLLQKEADINFKDQLESSAIHWACRGGSLEVVKVLENHGADLNVRDKLYSTPLHVATRTGHSSVVEYLLSCGAKINSRDREGDTPLHDAVRLNRYKIVKLLTSAGADTKIRNHDGKTAAQQVKEWQLDIMETLQRLDRLKEEGQLPTEAPQERSE